MALPRALKENKMECKMSAVLYVSIAPISIVIKYIAREMGRQNPYYSHLEGRVLTRAQNY